jgi:hypothetical protein
MACSHRRAAGMLATLLACGGLAAPAPAGAQTLLPNGDFESGDLSGWSAANVNGGRSLIATEGTCFSGNDTTGVQLNGNFAGLIRSNPSGDKDSVGSIISEPFTAGDAVLFFALSENRFGAQHADPVVFVVRIEDAAGGKLMSQVVHTRVVTLNPGCPSRPHHSAPTGHVIDTRAFRGQEVRLVFRQSTQVENEGFFTLIDDVTLYGAGEVPLFPDVPVAVAGSSLDDNGLIQLDASESFDPNDGDALAFTWYINGDTVPREGETVSVSDLEPGVHRALLVVNDGTHIATDTLLYVVPDSGEGETADVDTP